MSKPIPAIQKYMTHLPHSIGVDQTLAHAHAMMRKFDLRHLPVLTGGALVGLLSDRDLHLIETLRDVNPETVRVDEAMTSHVRLSLAERDLRLRSVGRRRAAR